MDNDDKNKSLIFQLYKKYKRSLELAKDNKEELPASSKEVSPSAVLPAIGEQAEDKAVAVTEPELSEPELVEPEIPEELKYIKDMYELYAYTCLKREDLQKVETIQNFEEWLYQSIREHPVYSDHLNVVHHFLEELNLTSSVLVNRFEREDQALAAKELREQTAGGENPEGLEAPETPELPAEDAEDWAYVLSEEPEARKKIGKVEKQKVLLTSKATIYVRSLEKGMCALLLITPPKNGEADIDLETLQTLLWERKIEYGVNRGLMHKIVSERLYMQLFVIAQGTPPINGIDGRIVDKTDCRKPKVVQQDEKGQVDFKSLDLYEAIEKDQAICELIPPVDGFVGNDIYGKELPFLKGKAVNFASGKNTIISEDGLLLLAAVGGYVTYRDKRYNVEPILIIPENVDYSVGNIDFSGNVIINGDVRFGFTVKAQGDITVKGMVEGAMLIADGNIIISKGMNGNHSGTLNAKGDIKVSYLENCTVYAEGAVYADSIIACDIYCDDAVYLAGNRGIIIGGSITALKSVEARMIGSKSQRETTIVLGETPRIVARKNSLNAEIEETVKVLEKLKLNINYLDKLRGSLAPDKLSILTQLTEQYSLYEQKKADLKQTLLVLMQESADLSLSYIKSNMIFPGTKIIIGCDSTVINTTISKCNIFFNNDEIQIGTF